MADTEYRIYIENQLIETSDTQVPTQESATPEQTVKKLSKEASEGNQVSKVIAVQMGKQALQFGVSNFGNLTGDYIAQNNISGAIEVAGLIGMMASGPVGMFAALGSMAIKGINYGVDLAKRNRETQFLRERTGMIGMNGGRQW